MKTNLKIDADTSKKISALSFFFTILVVGCHAGPWVYGGSLIARFFPGFLLFCAVPWFFFISGFMMFKSYSSDRQWWFDVMRKRVFTLYVPFILWNIFCLILKFALALNRGDIALGEIQYVHVAIEILGLNIFCEPPCGPFWYIRGLLFFTILAWCIGRLLRRPRIGGFVVFLLFLLNVLGVDWQLLSTGIKGSSTLYFFLGAYMALHYEALLRIEKKIRTSFVYLCIIIFSLIYISSVFGMNISKIRPLGIMCFLVSIYTLLYPLIQIGIGKFSRLFGYSFFIYGAHPTMITFLRMFGVNNIIGDSSGAVGYYCIWILSVIGAIACGMIVKKFFHPLYRVICGNRG